MADKRGGFTVGEKDIADPERIENHLKGLSLTGTKLTCTANPQGCIFRVGEVSRAGGTVQLIALSAFPPLRTDDIATFYYFSGHSPYRFGQRVIGSDPGRGSLHLHFPLVIRSNERRASPRFTFPKREEVHTAIITDLADGCGVSGPLRDLNLGGGALLAEKLVLIPSGKELRLVREALKLGPASLIKFRLPGGLGVECNGRLVHSQPDEKTFRVGFQFAALPPKTAAGLKAFLDGKFS